jgi:hypothetical protein
LLLPVVAFSECNEHKAAAMSETLKAALVLNEAERDQLTSLTMRRSGTNCWH